MWPGLSWPCVTWPMWWVFAPDWTRCCSGTTCQTSAPSARELHHCARTLVTAGCWPLLERQNILRVALAVTPYEVGAVRVVRDHNVGSPPVTALGLAPWRPGRRLAAAVRPGG